MNAGYFPSPWPAEDGGPQRLQTAPLQATLGLTEAEGLGAVVRRTCVSTMVVLGAPGEVFLLTHSVLRAHLGLPTTACVQRIDPLSLRTIAASPRLAGGPMWPGGMALHRNGFLYVVYGRYIHRLDRHCQPLAQARLPVDEPYNSFVVLDNGLIVTKNLSQKTAAHIRVLDADTLQAVAPDVQLPEPSVARLSARGNTVYVVGLTTVWRYHWDPALNALQADPDWQWNYIGHGPQSFGWDMVLAEDDAWFMDNGLHRYRYTMRGAGVVPTPNRLLRVSLNDAHAHQATEVCGLPGGSVTNPPLVDVSRRLVVGFDSANACLRAWRMGQNGQDLTPLWAKDQWGCASHMLLYPHTGELVVNDHRRWGEEVVVLDIATGAEKARQRIGGLMQGVVFPSVGWGRDFYWCSMGCVARLFAKPRETGGR